MIIFERFVAIAKEYDLQLIESKNLNEFFYFLRDTLNSGSSTVGGKKSVHFECAKQIYDNIIIKFNENKYNKQPDQAMWEVISLYK